MKLQGIFIHKGGYHRPAHWANELLNVFIAALLGIISLPVFVLISLVLWCIQGRPVFYQGTRLGIHKNKYQMYKFRTLVTNADAQLRGKLLGSRRELVTPAGKFLRDTRLDELPQLWNVLKRDMDMVGPRPVRPEIYKHLCKNIPNYDRRFIVRPALIGISQLFTPHSTPKAIRSHIDNHLLRKQEDVFWNIFALILTAFVVMRSIVSIGIRIFFNKLILQKLLGQYKEKRMHERVLQKQVSVYLQLKDESGNFEYVGKAIDINPEALLLRSNLNLDKHFPEGVIKLKANVKSEAGICGLKRSDKIKRAFCKGTVYRKTRKGDNLWDYVIMYQPLSPFNFYQMHQYFLSESMA